MCTNQLLKRIDIIRWIFCFSSWRHNTLTNFAVTSRKISGLFRKEFNKKYIGHIFYFLILWKPGFVGIMELYIFFVMEKLILTKCFSYSVLWSSLFKGLLWHFCFKIVILCTGRLNEISWKVKSRDELSMKPTGKYNPHGSECFGLLLKYQVRLG